MLQVIREYALVGLEASDGEAEGKEAQALRRVHAAYYLALAERAEPELTGSAAGAWLGRLEHEHDNLRAALGWAHKRSAVEMGLGLVAAIWRFWWTHGHAREGLAWAEGLLPLESAPPAPDGVADGAETVLGRGTPAASSPTTFAAPSGPSAGRVGPGGAPAGASAGTGGG
jgi:hypothetical protein